MEGRSEGWNHGKRGNLRKKIKTFRIFAFSFQRSFFLSKMSASSSIKLVSGATTAEQQEAVEGGLVNPFNGKPFTKQYKDILVKRKDLPVHKQRGEFLKLVHSSQMLVFVGETGSGKTTQLSDLVTCVPISPSFEQMVLIYVSLFFNDIQSLTLRSTLD